MRRVIIVGAGPIGIAAAVSALERGMDVTVLERGAAGEALLEWGETRFFTPLSMNISPSMGTLLGSQAPSPEALLTGSEMVSRVLEPIASSALLRDRILFGHLVTGIGRRGLTRGDLAGHPLRAERPFVVQIATGEGEQTLEADVILDASGGNVTPRAIGTGGLPAAGERAIQQPVIRTLGQLGSSRALLRGSRVLLVGHGHSAANAISVLNDIAEASPGTCITWAVRSANRRPCEEIANDPLPERERVASFANDLAADPPPHLSIERRASIERIDEIDGVLRVALTGSRLVEVDHIVAFTGYKPDSSFLGELPIELSPVTEGGARLYRAISSITDCLSVPKLRTQDLESGEPDFYFIGSRGYGRSKTFLLQTGLSQVEQILDRYAPRTSESKQREEMPATRGGVVGLESL